MTIRATQLASLIGAMCLSAAMLANAAGAPPMQLNIAAQPIDDALREFGRQSGLQVFLASQEGNGVTASAVNGSYTPAEALQKLLSNTGLRYEYIDERTIAIRPIAPRSEGWQKTSSSSLGSAGSGQSSETRASTKSIDDAATLETVNVFGTLDDELSVGSKSGQTLRETPKSITILNNERIEAQQITSLQEALIQTTGVAVSAFTPLDTFFYSRGIRLQTMQFDGGAPAYNGGFGFTYTPDTAVLERIEVLRGVDGIYSGAGEPGGVINLVRKAPKRNTEVRLDLSGGSWDNYRGVLDVTGPIALDGRLRGRAVASYMDRGYFWDRYTTEKQIFYGTLEMDVTDSTLLAVGMSHEQREDDSYPGYGGFPRYSNSASLGLPRGYNIAPEWARFHIKTRDVFARLEQRYGDTGVLKLNVSQIDQTGLLRFMSSYGTVNPVTLSGPYLSGFASDTQPKQRLADLSASGKFELFGRSHGYTVGIDHAKLDGGGQQDYRQPGFIFGNGVPYNIFQDQVWLRAEPAFLQNPFIAYPINEQSQRGIYATVGLQLAEPLRLTLGGRQGKYDYHQESRNAVTGVRSVVRYTDDAFIPSAALNYTLSEQWTAYVSFGETFKPQADLLAPPYPGNGRLDPVTGDNLELGVKGEIFERVNAAVAIYQLTRDGQGALDTTSQSASNPADGSRCCYIPVGEIKVQGADLEMSGTVLPDWQVFSGYTYTKTDFKGNPTGVRTLGRTPEHQVKIWSTWRLPDAWNAVTLNAGVIAQSSTVFDTVHFGGYTIWNASVQYRVSDHWSLALSGDNLTDKVYYLPTGTLYNQNVYGTPRSVSVSVRGNW